MNDVGLTGTGAKLYERLVLPEDKDGDFSPLRCRFQERLAVSAWLLLGSQLQTLITVREYTFHKSTKHVIFTFQRTMRGSARDWG